MSSVTSVTDASTRGDREMIYHFPSTVRCIVCLSAERCILTRRTKAEHGIGDGYGNTPPLSGGWEWSDCSPSTVSFLSSH